jgi:hypothetical protein
MSVRVFVALSYCSFIKSPTIKHFIIYKSFLKGTNECCSYNTLLLESRVSNNGEPDFPLVKEFSDLVWFDAWLDSLCLRITVSTCGAQEPAVYKFPKGLSHTATTVCYSFYSRCRILGQSQKCRHSRTTVKAAPHSALTEDAYEIVHGSLLIIY